MLDEELRTNGTTSLINRIESRLLRLAAECNDDDPELAIAYRQDAGKLYVLRFER
jgi:hypothetical protein